MYLFAVAVFVFSSHTIGHLHCLQCLTSLLFKAIDLNWRPVAQWALQMHI